MAEQLSLTQRVQAQILEQTINHRPILMDIATRIEPFTAEVIEVWSKVYREARVRDPLPPDEVVQGIQTAAVELFFGELKTGNLRQYFMDFESWGEQIALSGLSFDRVLKLLREYQRSGIPFLMRAYTAGPELEAAFNALDQLYSAMATILAATYIQSAQGQLIYGARSRALGQLATGASHALYNVLAAILGRAQLLSERARDTESRNELDDIRHTAAIGAEMARRLQEFARSGEDEAIIKVDVNLLLAQAADMTRFAWREQAEMDGLIIDIVKDFAEIPLVQARPSELRAVFIELLMNAVEAMPQGGVIALRTERKKDQVFASVIDKGTGMDEATRLRVFDPFFTTKSAPHPGLGLASASKIVSQYKGALTVESELGQGTTFTLGLPVAIEQDKVVEEIKKPEYPISVLFIDDDPAEQSLIKKFLSYHGYRIDAAENGLEGMALVRRHPYDLVFADLGMPGMSGWQVAEKITQFHPRILVVLMTPWAVQLDPEKIKASGAHRVVHKPIALDDVLKIVQEAALLKEKM